MTEALTLPCPGPPKGSGPLLAHRENTHPLLPEFTEAGFLPTMCLSPPAEAPETGPLACFLAEPHTLHRSSVPTTAACHFLPANPEHSPHTLCARHRLGAKDSA